MNGGGRARVALRLVSLALVIACASAVGVTSPGALIGVSFGEIEYPRHSVKVPVIYAPGFIAMPPGHAAVLERIDLRTEGDVDVHDIHYRQNGRLNVLHLPSVANICPATDSTC